MSDDSIVYNEELIEADLADLQERIEDATAELAERGERVRQWAAALSPCLHTADGIQHRLSVARRRRGELLFKYFESGDEAMKHEIEALSEEIRFIQDWSPEFIGRVLTEHEKWAARTELFRSRYEDRAADLKARRNLAPAHVLSQRETTMYGRPIRAA
ncbi:hypothetical protein [Methylococcus geothermalis]|uniref:Uncharacterized protein n=1 Tax=Methylococcus geothermalis TaxID=2681310 RepID=A0A858QBV7_9GAMM|nr:hypothetical protein [Methylococcus geothermalis]QJD31185.1 hypothetical protein GNH96_15375 [Methylococcus geothermalis]